MSEATLKKKIQIRNGHRLHVKKIISQIKDLTSPEGEKSTARLEAWKAELIKQQARIESLDAEIEELIDETAIEKEIIDKCEFNALIQETIYFIASSVSNKAPVSSTVTANNFENTGNVVGGQQNENTPAATTCKIKLPKFLLPQFAGDPTEWMSFWDSFSSAIHENDNLNDIDKFQYLKSCLRGSAAEAISGFQLTKANYKEAVKLLESRFANKQVVVSKHMEKLMELPEISRSEDVLILRQLYDQVEATVRSLGGIGVNSDSYGTFLIPIIMGKLPQEIRLILSRQLGNNWNLECLMKELRAEIQIRETCAFATTKEQFGENSRKTKKQQFTASSLTTGSDFYSAGNSQSSSTAKETGNATTWCSFCGGGHKSGKCTIVTDPSERKKILRQKGKCFLCLKSGHISRNCPRRKHIQCYRCFGNHSWIICTAGPNTKEKHKKSPQPRNANTGQSSQTVSTGNVNLYVDQDSKNNYVLLQTARAKIYAPNNVNNSCTVRLLLDSCSQKSYIRSSLRKQLSLPTISTDKVLIKPFGRQEAILKKCDTVQFVIECTDNLNVFVSAYEVDVICGPIANQTINFAQQHYPHLQNLPLADSATGDGDLDVDIMIGADYYWSFVQNHVVRGESNYSPVAIRTRLGYVLSGPINLPSGYETSSYLNISHSMKTECSVLKEDFLSQDGTIRRELNKFWDYETLGIRADECDESKVYADQIKFNGTRYEASLPFKQDHPVIPDNYRLAQGRLCSLLRRLRSEPQVLHQYDNVIKEQLATGVVELANDEKTVEPGNVHYIPHREVLREDRSTTKLRVVYDASSKQNDQISLNDCLLPGPPLTPLIFNILLRFRVNQVAIVSDLEKAFLNVEINPKQRDLLRFLWVENVDSPNPQVQTLRFNRLVFGLVSSPFILNATIRNHLSKYRKNDPQFVDDVLNSLYVDDYASGKNSVSDCFEQYQKLKKCFQEGGFNMRKWASNSEELSEMIEREEESLLKLNSSAELNLAQECNVNTNVMEEDQGFSKLTLNSAVLTDKEIKVLGVAWNKNSDTLRFSFSAIVDHATSKNPTKREVLSATSKFYDPLGLLSPVIIPLKCMFQEICQHKVNWDTPIPDELKKKWIEIMTDMSKVQTIEIPRCVLPSTQLGGVISLQLHGFSDASKSAYGANVYLRGETTHGYSTHLIASKTRVAPLKGDTIPRLELMGALTLAKLITSVAQALQPIANVNSIYCWSDSQIVLWWIYGDTKQFKQFIQNRVIQIRNLVSKEHWQYCPTNLNPSDIASRGIKCSEIVSNNLWWKGPPFLEKDQKNWPNKLNCPKISDEVLEEETQDSTKSESNSLSTQQIVAEPCPSVNTVIPCQNYSSLTRLLRITALVQRFVKLLKEPPKDPKLQSELSAEEIKSAETLWHRDIQASIKDLRKSNKQLGVYEDENGVLRCKGRIQNSSLPYDTKFPVLLPQKHHFTELIILQCHAIVKHNGVRETLTQVRSHYWIPKGRQEVKRLLSRCVKCRKITGKPCSAPPPPPLPQFRVSDDLAFSQVGVDFAGPLYVRDIYTSNSEMHKCQIALFTCASTRAIHLELTPNLSASSFQRALKRFMARRGIPTQFISDNGKTFCDAGIQKFATTRNITWKFNVPTASWWGGFFEICVKLVKKCLRKVLGNAKLTYEQLETVLAEIEGVLNSRPLTYVYDEIDEPPLTPSSLVFGKRLLDQNPMSENSTASDARLLSKRAKYLQRLLAHFRNRWRNEYLTGIREYQRLSSTNENRMVNVGDIVHIHDKLPRVRWKIGKVDKLLPGKDGIVRAAELTLLDKSQRVMRTKRPIQKLYPLEVSRTVSDKPVTFIAEDDVPFVRTAHSN